MTRATLLTESLMRLSPLMGERKQENGVYLPTVYQMVFGCVSCSQFLLPPKKKKKKSDCIQILGVKRSDTG